MGFKFSKPSQGKVENLSLQHHLINYLSKSFYIRNLVSKQRRRMLVAGYDLDMSYITDHVLAMSFPAERMRAVYRNPLWQVKSVLDMRHQGHYKIYNLCIEESYDPSHFHGRVESFPFDDNHVPHLQMIKIFCENVSSWLSSHPKNIAVIHCMAGKGRTGLMVCAYLVYCGMSVEDALQLYAQRRTTNNEGVSIPSQRRYVGYWSKCLSFPKGVYNGPPEVKLPKPCRRELQRIRLYDTVNTESIFFVVSELQEVPSQLYRPSMELTRSCCRRFKRGYERSNSPRYFLSFVEGENEGSKSTVEPHLIVQMDTESSALYHKSCLDYNFEKPLPLTGDVRIIFYAKMFGGRLFYACFNTAFIKNSLLQLRLQDLDKVGKKGRSLCGPSFCLELVFGPANAKHSYLTSSDDDEDPQNDLS
ncbi:phosphatidylinositol 3,4,5-trisphosphate 3-phosphatase and protein-tyrosine-phosphatase PTEN1 [Benincasa hispida]|uniref:phosphatidylinositol 3,4,5-trisphosphate 3-phosphatase and protein-tyrosine-phosphatase PTEN1 n=1 Tax=Benincasa hispida TaxID=102211 RepID=UPI001901E701|nr:phosphatidylinositol 3,4,5-trisphosphate 3-phosphatase and protein-tyrosine-phosphatase PTEN1 [Benincasa hispida]XP_038903305.1 phosphatidylinositol 3,4,5-trisphosphate 3-phosphatase and protein-tyrosine-phosphatase PTEN1 [Benincasa hispida]XP_038903306.1 phosphatidylinositol 3,4,5-trisphosphate 3-phosphatase and protein-tyrosine-phosphatase PTEN1 [Benincasa hispida]